MVVKRKKWIHACTHSYHLHFLCVQAPHCRQQETFYILISKIVRKLTWKQMTAYRYCYQLFYSTPAHECQWNTFSRYFNCLQALDMQHTLKFQWFKEVRSLRSECSSNWTKFWITQGAVTVTMWSSCHLDINKHFPCWSVSIVPMQTPHPEHRRNLKYQKKALTSNLGLKPWTQFSLPLCKRKPKKPQPTLFSPSCNPHFSHRKNNKPEMAKV